MVRVTKIRPLSLGRALMIVSLVFGIVVAIVTSYKLLNLGPSAYSNFAIIVVLITLGYALFGFLVGFLSAIVYNLTLKLHGGVKIETEQIS